MESLNKTKPYLKRVDTGIVPSLLYPNRIGFLLKALIDMNKNNNSYNENRCLTISKCEKNMYNIEIKGAIVAPNQSYTLKIEEDEIENLYTLSKINMKLVIDSILYDPYVNIINFWQTEVKV